jgi:hypothetical protein
MNCPFLKDAGHICTAEMQTKERSHVPTAIELNAFCRRNEHTLCYFFFINKDASDKRS